VRITCNILTSLWNKTVVKRTVNWHQHNSRKIYGE